MKNKPPPITASNADILSTEFWFQLVRSLTESALRSLLQVIAILVMYLLLRAVVNRLIDGILARLLAHESRLGISDERTGRLQTLQGLSKSVVGYVLFFVFGILFLKAVGFDIMPFITTAGVIGLAIGFGAQKLVKDLISGFFIIIDNQFVVGDTITLGAITGVVQEMGMRVTRLEDSSGRVHMMANGDIGLVTNLSRHPVTDFIEVNVAPTADLNTVIMTINTAGDKLAAQPDEKLKAAPHVLGITAFSATSVTIRVSVVSEPNNLVEEQMHVRGGIRTALLEANIPLA